MAARYIQDDDSVDYTPGSNVTAGDVIVQGDLVGVAKLDIVSGRLGALAVEGVFDFPKTAGASTAIAVGTKVYWDDANSVATSTAGSLKYLGKTIRATVDADTTVRVRLQQ